MWCQLEKRQAHLSIFFLPKDRLWVDSTSSVSAWVLTLLETLAELSTERFQELPVNITDYTGVTSLITGKIIKTGLDPAYPDFSLANTADRLDTTDGTFVDVIHTNSGTLAEGCLSFPDAIGHVDFWPNGGAAQPVQTDITSRPTVFRDATHFPCFTGLRFPRTWHYRPGQ